MDKEEIVKLYIYGLITDNEFKQLVIGLEPINNENLPKKISEKIDKNGNLEFKEE